MDDGKRENTQILIELIECIEKHGDRTKCKNEIQVIAESTSEIYLFLEIYDDAWTIPNKSVNDIRK
jgi:hypothetical protein